MAKLWDLELEVEAHHPRQKVINRKIGGETSRNIVREMIADSANLPDLQQFSSNNLHIFSFGNASAHMATQRIEPRITVPFRLTIHIETSLKKDRGRSHSGIRLTRTQGRIHDMVIKFMIM